MDAGRIIEEWHLSWGTWRMLLASRRYLLCKMELHHVKYKAPEKGLPGRASGGFVRVNGSRWPVLSIIPCSV